MSELGKRVGQRIRELRTLGATRCTQEDLAERAQISVSFLSMIERGERVAHLDTLASLARALGVGLGTLLEGADPEESEANASVWKPVVDFVREKRLSKEEVSRLVTAAHGLFPNR